MSYSFLASGPSKTDAILEVEAKFDKVCSDMPVHEADKDLVLAHMRNCVNTLPDPQDDEAISVSMSGYLSGTWDGAAITRLSTLSAACAVSLQKKG